MSGKRPPAPPPALPGFTYVSPLGSGGFADVYLYEQHLPRRRVAIKVMLADRMTGDAAEQFTAEANVMALLSTHPAIVTIHQAGVSDDGRPYLVMEYCPKPNLQIRSRAAPFSIAEALRVGVQVAAAVETAHRAGILHRDIKPANILVTDYNRPALTDFGIATTAETEESSAGMSIPWSPPESFSDRPSSGVATDVYALGATVYTLLAGRSPFEQPGGRNGGADLIARIESERVPALARADAPPSLQSVLERSMARRPEDRYESAVAFARALQRIQIELAHSVTPIDILDDAPPHPDEDDADGELTRVRGIVSIEPQTSPAAGPTRRRDAVASARVDTAGDDDRTLLRGPATISPEGTVAAASARVTATGTGTSAIGVGSDAAAAGDAFATIRRTPAGTDPPASAAGPASAQAEPAAKEQAKPRSRRGLWIGLSAAAAIVVVGGVAAVAGALGGARPEPQPSASVLVQNPVSAAVPAVAELAGTLTGATAAAGDEAVFTWTNPEPRDGDSYLWYPYTLAGDGQAQRASETTVSLPADPGGTTCIAVMLLREDGAAGAEKRACTP